MPEIHVINGRLFATSNARGLIVRRDELALVEQSDGVAFVLSGDVLGGDGTGVATMTTDARLRVDSRPATDERNLFSGDPWAGTPNPFG